LRWKPPLKRRKLLRFRSRPEAKEKVAFLL